MLLRQCEAARDPAVRAEQLADKVRAVALLAAMQQYDVIWQMPSAVEQLANGDEGLRVGKMASAAGNSALNILGASAVGLHLGIVIAFQRDAVKITKAPQKMRGDMAKVGCVSDAIAETFDHKSINTFVKLDFDAEVYDTNANFDPSTDRFQPTVAGKYLVTAAVDCTNATGGLCFSNIYKNGLRIAVAGNSVATAGDNVHNVTTVVDMNGSSDYLEAFVYSGGNTVTISADMAFTGTLLGPQTGGSGGGATPAGTDTQVQFNDGGSALGTHSLS